MRRNRSPLKRINPSILLLWQRLSHLQACWLHLLWNLNVARDATAGISAPVAAGPKQHFPKWLLGVGWELPWARDYSQQAFCIGLSCPGVQESLIVWMLAILCQLTSMPQNGPGYVQFTDMGTDSDVSLQDTWCQLWDISQWPALFFKDFKDTCPRFETYREIGTHSVATSISWTALENNCILVVPFSVATITSTRTSAQLPDYNCFMAWHQKQPKTRVHNQ